MSGKQTVFKTMNKGSWRMLQDCTIYATVHRLNKAKNNTMKDDSQISICEGQPHLAGAYTRGQKKAQRCFNLFVPCIFQTQLISECFTANFVWCAIFQREGRIFPVMKNKSPAMSSSVGNCNTHFLPTCSVRDLLPLSENPSGCYRSTSSLLTSQYDFNWEFQNVWWKLTLLTFKFPC